MEIHIRKATKSDIEQFREIVHLAFPAYYQRFGFETAIPLGIQNEYGVDHEFMVIRLSSRDLAAELVRYAEEFTLFSV